MTVSRSPAGPHDGSVVVDLDRQECLDLLAEGDLGRVAVSRPGRAPLVLLATYRLEGETIVFCTNDGATFDALCAAPISLEVDAVDPFHHTGWTVLVEGDASEVPPGEVDTDLHPWIGGGERHLVRIRPDLITGRRVTSTGFHVDARGYL